MLRADVVPVGGQSAQVGGAGRDQLRPPVREIRRDLDPDLRASAAASADQLLHVLDRHPLMPTPGRKLRALADACPPIARRPRRSDLRRLLAVLALMGHEVLEDHLLQMPVLGVDRGERFQRREAVLAALADPDQDPPRERDPQLAGRRGSSPAAGPDPWSASPDAPPGPGASTPASAPATLSPPQPASSSRSTRRGSCAAAAPLQRLLADPHDVGDEIRRTPVRPAAPAPPR